MFSKLFSKKNLGIDIGTSSIKLVELSSFFGKIKLENYGEIQTSVLSEKPFWTLEGDSLFLSTEDIVKAIRAIIKETQIKTQKSIFSIPDFCSFFTTFELPSMTPEELNQAVEAEARRHVALPLSDVTLDWQLISGEGTERNRKKLKILLVAVPNKSINQYQKIVFDLKLELLALEAEVFASLRSLINKDEKRAIGLIEIGARSTTCSIIDEGVLKTSYSFDTSGNTLTQDLVEKLSLDYGTAEELKKNYGILSSSGENLEKKQVRDALISSVDFIVKESEEIFKNFFLKEDKEIAKIILAGGTALLPGLQPYFQNYFKKEIEIADPFSRISYPEILKENLKKMGPSYAIAVGLALRGLKKNG